jgi:hypothetical protein
VPSYVWISLGVFFIALIAGAIWAGINARRAYTRGLPAFRRMSEAAESLNGRSAKLERGLTVLEPKVAQLQRDRARLSRAVAKARVLFGAVQEVRTVYRVARIFGP